MGAAGRLPGEQHRDGPMGRVDPARPVLGAGATDAYLDEQEDESFPASDPHADWAGAPPWS